MRTCSNALRLEGRRAVGGTHCSGKRLKVFGNPKIRASPVSCESGVSKHADLATGHVYFFDCSDAIVEQVHMSVEQLDWVTTLVGIKAHRCEL